MLAIEYSIDTICSVLTLFNTLSIVDVVVRKVVSNRGMHSLFIPLGLFHHQLEGVALGDVAPCERVCRATHHERQRHQRTSQRWDENFVRRVNWE